MQAAEIELKFPVDDLVRLQSRLPALGFHLDTPRTFEQNTLYDTPTRTLRESKQLLRLRHYGGLWTVTHKRPASPGNGAETCGSAAVMYKVRIETETRIDDGPALAAIFEQLGYSPVFHYEKFRTEWSQATAGIEGPLFPTSDPLAELSHGHLVLDETPIGNYAELEGPTAWIDDTLAKLSIDPGICITDSYGKLFLAWKERTASPAEHLTFELVAASETLAPALR
jgi:adenylate cyclase class 2